MPRIKGIPSFNSTTHELVYYFKEWDMDEYARKKRREEAAASKDGGSGGGGGNVALDELHQKEEMAEREKRRLLPAGFGQGQ